MWDFRKAAKVALLCCLSCSFLYLRYVSITAFEGASVQPIHASSTNATVDLLPADLLPTFFLQIPVPEVEMRGARPESLRQVVQHILHWWWGYGAVKGTPGGTAYYLRELATHPRRRWQYSDADIIFIEATFEQAGPKREQVTYVFFGGWLGCGMTDPRGLPVRRDDLLCICNDRRGHDLRNDSAELYPGTTLPPERFYGGLSPADADLSSWTWLLSYQGSPKPGWFESSQAGPSLAKGFKHFQDPRVKIVIHHKRISEYTSADATTYQEILGASAFTLLPHGDMRWRYAFSEAIGACSVPVILADGLELPLEAVINWSGAVLQIPEALAGHPKALLAALPNSDEEILAMRRRVCDINRMYFATTRRRLEAVLLALAGSRSRGIK
ncbi:unnamed protein product [Polarella glacialis]|uniref:Exostosin GT47 domain-containing protein n=1 Tax=Polarella glacialis TaxID=89957 RepID=A0A813D9E5_POLGL|nr:unnamed protein product [Polarella glacialis]